MKYQRFYCIALTMLLASITFAANNSSNSNYWTCDSQDKEHKIWTATNSYQKAALNLAFSECKKGSQFPSSCSISKTSCNHFVEGVNTTPLWKCTTFDRGAQPWDSNYYVYKDDAALASQAFCKQNSSLPETCYTNFITCSNLNEGAEHNGLFSGINW